MTRSAIYVCAVAAAFADTPVECRREAWRSLEAGFRVAYLRDHPCATDDQVEAAFLELAKAVSERMAAQ